MSIRLSVGPSVGWSVCRSVGNAFVSVGRDEPANDLFCVYKLVFHKHGLFLAEPGKEIEITISKLTTMCLKY